MRLVSSVDLTAPEGSVLRRLCDEAFDGSFSDDDWAHALGGIHAIASRTGVDAAGMGESVVGHAALVPRTLWCIPGVDESDLSIGLPEAAVAVSAGYVEAVAVRADHRRRGIADELMRRLELMLADQYEFGALCASKAGLALYRKRGWVPWSGPLGARMALGEQSTIRFTPEEAGAVLVRTTDRTPRLVDPGGHAILVCDHRPGDAW